MQPFLKFLALSAIFSTASLQAAEFIATDREAKSAYDQSINIYTNEGLTGLIINSQNCHAMSKNKVKCVYLDIVGLRLDMAVVGPMGMPRHPYFETEAVFKRSDTALLAAGVPESDKAELFGSILKKVQNYL